MRRLEVTLNTPAENLALDEALLDLCENAPQPVEVLRLWESPQPIVVIGRSSRIDVEVNRGRCANLGIPILRRSSGGTAIVAGRGCLMYGVVLSYELRPELRSIDEAHRFVLGVIAEYLRELLPGVEHQGLSDLAIADQKISGNSMRCKRNGFLYHGTLLYDFPLDLIEACLNMPPRQPEYRAGRSHDDFVMNAPASADDLRQALIAAWDANMEFTDWPREETVRLAIEKYSQEEWTLRL
jgi:lipoate-protein ligase A